MTLGYSKTVGIVGLGMLGASITERLLNLGTTINIYNRDKTKLKNFEKMGAKSFDNLCNLANESDFIITCVTNFESLKDVLFNKQGISDSHNNELIIADCTTIRPDQSSYCAKLLKEKNGITLLSAPVMGGPSDAKNGELITLISGDEKSFDKMHNIFNKISKRVFYLGENNGISNSIKLALNLNIAIISLAFSEGIILSMHSGIDPETYLKIFNITKLKTGISENKGQKILKNDFSPSFFLKNMLKDLDLIMETSQSLQLSLPVTSLTQQLFQAANNCNDLKNKDYSAIFQFLDKLNGSFYLKKNQ
ncbi:MAG: NAD(P)-dependent oxidoreductase [Nitrosopumilus sp.]|nr:NAD(P)-dependent oxidoreductase [Nitrosopumilus sp.]